ncbi:MAG: hypothetical protein HRU19_30775, partial [Pseudobacteriovorax sp.]|nr:hypothetical protein [Pseudobacteriovorax sp.]
MIKSLLKFASVLLVSSTQVMAVEPGIVSDQYTDTHNFTANSPDIDFRVESFYGTISGASLRSGRDRPTAVFAQTPRVNFPSSVSIIAHTIPSVSYRFSGRNIDPNIPVFTAELLVDENPIKSLTIYTRDLNQSCSEKFFPPSSGVCAVPNNRFLDECRRYYRTTCSYSGINKPGISQGNKLSFSHVSTFLRGSVRLRFLNVHPNANLGV